MLVSFWGSLGAHPGSGGFPGDFSDTSSNRNRLDLISANSWMWFSLPFLQIKGVLFSRKFLLKVQKSRPPSWKCFSALLAFSHGRRAASNNLQDLCYLSHSGGRGFAGSKHLKPSWFFLLPFCPVPCLRCDVLLRPLCASCYLGDLCGFRI